MNHTATHFLMRTFRNVLYVRVGKCYVCCACERSFEKARGETEAGRRLLVPEPHPLPPRTRPAGTQTESQLEPATSVGVILPETGQFLLLCSLQLWQQLQRCRQTPARSTIVFDTNVKTKDIFLGEANSYKQALALRNLQLISQLFSPVLLTNNTTVSTYFLQYYSTG